MLLLHKITIAWILPCVANGLTPCNESSAHKKTVPIHLYSLRLMTMHVFLEKINHVSDLCPFISVPSADMHTHMSRKGQSVINHAGRCRTNYHRLVCVSWMIMFTKITCNRKDNFLCVIFEGEMILHKTFAETPITKNMFLHLHIFLHFHMSNTHGLCLPQ